MKIEAASVDEYIEALPEDRKDAMIRLRHALLENLPDGFSETMQYNLPSYVVPHDLYPSGYHVSPDLPLPFISIASQKNFVALYHMGIYSSEELLTWFQEEYAKRVPTKLDMGKSCIRFKKIENIPYDLVAELAQRMTPDEWIAVYESSRS